MRRKVVLFPTYEQALSYRKQCAAKNPEGLFAVNVDTPFTWLKDAWERFGDGTTLVSSLERAFAVKHILDTYAESLSALSTTEGSVSLLSRFFADVVGSAELVSAQDNPSAFSEAENQLFSLIEPYRNLLKKRNLIEQGDALARLSSLDLPFEFNLEHLRDIPLYFQRFFDQVDPQSMEALASPVQITKTAPCVQPIALLATGPSAQNVLILQTIQEILDLEVSSLSSGDVLIVSCDPAALFEYVARGISSEKEKYAATNTRIACELSTSIPFAETDFGRCFNALKAFLLDDSHEVGALLDYVTSPFSGVEPLQAAQIVSAIHGDRLFSYEEAHAMIRLVSPHFDMFEELFQDSDASLVLDYFYDVAADISGKDPAYRSEQGSAITALRTIYEQARRWQSQPGEFDFALEGITIDCSRCIAISGDTSHATKPSAELPQRANQMLQSDQSKRFSDQSTRRVIIADSNSVQNFFGQSFDQVIVCDLDSRSYSAQERHDALSTLEKKMKIESRCKVLQSRRQWFEQVKALATQKFYCERILNSGEDEDIYPSFVWEEFFSCYLEADEELDRRALAPLFARGGTTVVRDEASYDWNANSSCKSKKPLSLIDAKQGVLASPVDAELDPTGTSSRQQPLRPDLFLSRIGSYEQEELILSPSAIEAYINCPYLWFVSYRIRPESPDEQLGPLEQGTFVHGVFEHFYKKLPTLVGQTRLTKENLKQARKCFSEVFDEQLALQRELPSTRYVPLTSLEKAQAHKLKQVLLKNIVVQSHLMPEFSPTYGEFEIRPENFCEYAGVVIRGRIDRIDTNPATGQLVVIDYKGGIYGHDAGYDPDVADDFVLPHKIQTLIYAQALKKILPERAVGALYLSYRAQENAHSVAGSYDDAFLNLAGFARSASAVKGNFDQYLSLVEEAVFDRLEEMKRGVIEQRPLCADSCTYCPVLTCPRRLS